jgi:hypothetical protein
MAGVLVSPDPIRKQNKGLKEFIFQPFCFAITAPPKNPKNPKSQAHNSNLASYNQSLFSK